MRPLRVFLLTLAVCLTAILGAACRTSRPVAARVDTGLKAVAESPTWATRVTGICDASAALLRADGTLVIASDDHNTLSVFDRASGAKLGDLTPSLDRLLEDAGIELQIDGDTGLPREIDVEGAAMLRWDGQNVAVWVGSHGRRKAKWDDEDDDVRSAKRRTNRQVLMATRLPQDGTPLTLVGSPVITLSDAFTEPPPELEDVLAPLVAAEPLWPNAGGWNIEGLAADPQGRLLIGFRSPVGDDKRALVLRLDNPRQAFGGDEAEGIVLDAAEWLDLGARGIRSMDWSPAHESWLIVAGPVDNVDVTRSDLPQLPGYAEDFAVFRWQGFGHRPVEQALDLKDLRPEILVPAADGFYLISDDGKEPRPGGEDCGTRRSHDPHHPDVYARARFFALAP